MDKEEFKMLMLLLAAVGIIALLVIAVAVVASSNSSGQPVCPRGSVPTYIYHSGWICTIAPVTP